MAVTRPVLRYHGSKFLLAPWIISHFPEHETYVEAYGGGGSVLLRKPRSKDEIYNDLDGDVVNLFRILRDEQSTSALCARLELTPYSREEFKAAYDQTSNDVERAARMVIRSFMGFGTGAFNRDYVTGFRAASKQCGRPHAKDWANLPECLWLVTERMRGVCIENRDALAVIKQQDSPTTLFYLDPPYPHSSRPNSNHTQYRFEMHGVDHESMVTMLRRVKGKVILSGYQCPLYEELLSGWRRVFRLARAASQTGFQMKEESLWMNFPA